MPDNSTPVDRNGLYKRLLIPVGALLVTWLLLNGLYNLLGHIEDVSLYRTLAAVNWVLLVICVGFGTVIIYPVMYANGASQPERILGAYVMPMAWCLKEFIRVTAGVTIPEGI
ncbi:MAG: hypothetical protein JRJ37_10755, partial [Deltaproteobacteria bacterium]|nr:hypothetical protein [Deltaproteobacteria bacterium]